MLRSRSALVAFFALALTAPSVVATTYIVGTDREMITDANAIVVGTVTGSSIRRAQSGAIETLTTVTVEEHIKGPTTAREIIIVNWGGRLNEQLAVQVGAPQFSHGERVLLFLEPTAAGEWTTFRVGLGAFLFAEGPGGRTLERSEIKGWRPDGRPHVESPRLAEPFLEYVRAIVRGEEESAPQYASPNIAPLSWTPQPNAVFTSGGYTGRFSGQASTPIRRFSEAALSAEWRLFGTQADLDMAEALDFSIPKWNSRSPLINYDRSDTPASGDDVASDSESRVVANDPNSVVPGSCCANNSVIATAFQFGTTSSQSFNGEQFFPITHSDIVVNNGATAANLGQGKFNVTLAHELGHTLGLRHADQNNTNGTCELPLDCCASGCSAVMKASVSGSLSGLEDWDRRAIDCLYDAVCEDGLSCTPPSITTQPTNKSISTGQSTTLTVVAGGTNPFTYQWFIGTSGDTSTPTGTNAATLNTGALTTTTSFWVRVTGQCAPPKDSNTATVTVTCAPPSISTHPQNKTITAGSTTSLSVTASGTGPLSYQWFIGTSGDTSTPTGTNSSTLSSLSPATTTSYWVRVTGQCGSPANSNTATVTVNAACPNVVIHSATATAAGAGFITLSATATGGTGLTYTWFRGNTPGSGGTQIGTGATLSNVAISAPTNYWVRVRNSCDKTAVSDLVAAAPCGLPSIVTQPADTTVPPNGTATLSIVLADPNHTTRWYQGAPPSKAVQVGTGDTITAGPVAATTTFWAAVTNSCGEVASRTVTVTVALCTAPSITTQPLSQQIKSGESATLSVVAAGTEALSYFWFQGELGDETTPVGSNASTITVGPLLKTTKFWVRVTNACGFTTSLPATITVSPPKRRAVRQ